MNKFGRFVLTEFDCNYYNIENVLKIQKISALSTWSYNQSTLMIVEFSPYFLDLQDICKLVTNVACEFKRVDHPCSNRNNGIFDWFDLIWFCLLMTHYGYGKLGSLN